MLRGLKQNNKDKKNKSDIFARTTKKSKNYKVKNQNSYSYEQFAYLSKYIFTNVKK